MVPGAKRNICVHVVCRQRPLLLLLWATLVVATWKLIRCVVGLLPPSPVHAQRVPSGRLDSAGSSSDAPQG